ncbi:hypothetical protein, partial [Candidatus Accumulibacter phosphatis]|uniref:hypothetical protein n=1 Tax=Candidatus Accumulibacter phosphatis TaxID=327160 RepID=UPI0039B88A58
MSLQIAGSAGVGIGIETQTQQGRGFAVDRQRQRGCLADVAGQVARAGAEDVSPVGERIGREFGARPGQPGAGRRAVAKQRNLAAI